MKNEFPLVSVLIPTYNCANYLKEAIDSALQQTWPCVEVIVVDDGSTDDTPSILQSYGNQIYWTRIDNGGACIARNRALELSHGVFIQYLDADDRILPNKLEVQLPDLIIGKSDLVVCNGFLFGDGREIRPIKQVLSDPTGEDPFIYCLKRGLSTEGPLIRRSCVERVKGFDATLKRAQEFEFHLRLAANGVRITKVDQLLFAHRHDDRPTRITKQVLPVDYFLSVLIELSKTLEDPMYNFNELRRTALAGAIHQHAIYAFRNGARVAAAKGFDRAKKLSANYSYSERAWVKLLSQLTSPVMVEKFLAFVRTIR